MKDSGDGALELDDAMAGAWTRRNWGGEECGARRRSTWRPFIGRGDGSRAVHGNEVNGRRVRLQFFASGEGRHPCIGYTRGKGEKTERHRLACQAEPGRARLGGACRSLTAAAAACVPCPKVEDEDSWAGCWAIRPNGAA
jgi:hypothetical protein